VSKLRDILRLTAAGMSSRQVNASLTIGANDHHRLSGARAAGWATAGRSDRRNAGGLPQRREHINSQCSLHAPPGNVAPQPSPARWGLLRVKGGPGADASATSLVPQI